MSSILYQVPTTFRVVFRGFLGQGFLDPVDEGSDMGVGARWIDIVPSAEGFLVWMLFVRERRVQPVETLGVNLVETLARVSLYSDEYKSAEGEQSCTQMDALILRALAVGSGRRSSHVDKVIWDLFWRYVIVREVDADEPGWFSKWFPDEVEFYRKHIGRMRAKEVV